MRLFGLSLLNKGNFTPASGMFWTISAPMTEAEIDATVAEFSQTLDELMPLIQAAAPELLSG
jgi:hypothetical protein